MWERRHCGIGGNFKKVKKCEKVHEKVGNVGMEKMR
jgi:hypothetical protein